VQLLPINEIACKLGLGEEYLEPCSSYGAKINLSLLADTKLTRRGKLILVTATTPTKSGEGKTVVSIGLAQGLERLGKRVVVTSREPSLGPVFGLKGGAAGGGLAQVEPSDKINLHFHGDFHAITSAHNLLAAMLDAHLFHGNELNLDVNQITWPRTMDMNDRPLRQITIGQGARTNGPVRQSGFVITAASEVMAIMGMSSSREDLRRRLGAIVVGFSNTGKPVTADDLQSVGPMMALLNDAILPNLVQTTEGTPALVHTGPFGNIAHGTSSVISQNMGLKLADYVVNECGFASDLGAEKYFNLVMRSSGLAPSVAVLVTTVQSLKGQGTGGLANLSHHVEILRKFGVSIVVAMNRFPNDTDAELQVIEDHCTSLGLRSARVDAFSKGGAGATDLAARALETIENSTAPDVRPLYPLEAKLEEKIRTVATEVYGAADVSFTDVAREKLSRFSDLGFANFPICMAKTQYSLSDDPALLGAPTGWTLRVRDANLSAGAGFIVVVAGNMMLMPGLPKLMRAHSIDVDADGNIAGVG
jgi:formate--tetrahydrofolate ligase